jgi:hypothetical protein
MPPSVPSHPHVFMEGDQVFTSPTALSMPPYPDFASKLYDHQDPHDCMTVLCYDGPYRCFHLLVLPEVSGLSGGQQNPQGDGCIECMAWQEAFKG